MNTYEQIIAQFAHALDDGTDTTAFISASSQNNFSIYRNNIQINRINALRIAFPTIDSLVGSEFFEAMSLVYVQQTPLNQANLHAEDADFAQFLAQFPHTEDYPYLPDVARLDWAIHHAHYAPDINTLRAEEIAKHAEQLATTRFEFHPAMALIASRHPIVSILAMHHGGPSPEDLNIPEQVIVWRDQYLEISAADYQFLSALHQRHTVTEALDAAAQIDPDYNPGFAIGLLIQQNLIIAMQID